MLPLSLLFPALWSFASFLWLMVQPNALFPRRTHEHVPGTGGATTFRCDFTLLLRSIDASCLIIIFTALFIRSHTYPPQ